MTLIINPAQQSTATAPVSGRWSGIRNPPSKYDGTNTVQISGYCVVPRQTSIARTVSFAVQNYSTLLKRLAD